MPTVLACEKVLSVSSMPALPPRQQEKDFDAKLFFQECLPPTFMYETWLGFRSAVLTLVTKRNLKIKLQIYTEHQPCFIHFVVGCPFTPNLFFQFHSYSSLSRLYQLHHKSFLRPFFSFSPFLLGEISYSCQLTVAK